jgi:homoserine kinase
VYNIGRAAMLVSALYKGDYDILRQATQDRLHQPQRGQGFPALSRLIKAALNGGAHGAFLSGAGPSVMALTTGREVTVTYEMAEAARLSELPGKSIVLKPARHGAYVVEAQ